MVLLILLTSLFKKIKIEAKIRARQRTVLISCMESLALDYYLVLPKVQHRKDLCQSWREHGDHHRAICVWGRSRRVLHLWGRKPNPTILIGFSEHLTSVVNKKGTGEDYETELCVERYWMFSVFVFVLRNWIYNATFAIHWLDSLVKKLSLENTL